MGAVCGKSHTLNEQDAPYESKNAAESPTRNKGKEETAEEVDDEVIAVEEKDDLKSEARLGTVKVQFPEQQNIHKYMDPETSTTCFVNSFDSATLVSQKGEFFTPSVFHYTFGLNCCACKNALNDSCTLIFGFTFHQNSHCLCCTVCNAPLTGVNKKSDITISSSGKLFCDSCSVKEAPATCGCCNEQLTEDELDLSVVAVGRRFRATCLKCSCCQLPLSNVKIFKEGKLFCGNCHTDSPSTPSCHQCSRKIVGRSLNVADKAYHIDCVKCPKCCFKICDNEGVYLVEGSPPVHMDCSKSVSSEFYKITTDDEGLFSTFEDMGSDSDRGGHASDSRKTKFLTDFSYSSINTSFSSLPFSKTDRPETNIPAVYRLKNANQYIGSYLKPERDLNTKPGNVNSFTVPVVQNGTKATFNYATKNGTSGSVPNGSMKKTYTAPNRLSGGTAPRKIDSHDYSGPLAPVYYKKERERRRQEKARAAKLDILSSSARPAGGMANGHKSGGDGESDTERLNSSSAVDEGDVSSRLDGSSSVQSTVRVRVAVNGHSTDVVSSDTEYDTDTYANGDVVEGRRKPKSIEGSDVEGGKGGYVTEDEIDRMQSGLGKEILREMKMQIESNPKEDVEIQYVPDDPIKASRSPDAKTEVQLPYFCEIKFGPIATGINRYCDSWLLEQASKEPMSLKDYSNFIQGFQKFANASGGEPWKSGSAANGLVDGAMSDTEGMRRITSNPVGSGRMYGGGYRSDGYKSEGGYGSSPDLGRKKMTRYNSLDVRKAWYHERFLTYVQMYHKKGNLLFEQQKEACMQHVRKSMGSLGKSADLKVYPKEKLFTNVNKKLPQDVNRSRLELHLSDEEFIDLFAMTQDQFRSLPAWKQNVLKQLNYLF